MPHLPSVDAEPGRDEEELVFPPVTKDHIQNCSYDAWFPRYRSSCLKSRIIPLPQTVVAYLQEDGIVLADDDEDEGSDVEEEWQASRAFTAPPRAHDDGADESDDDDAEAPEPLPPNKRFPETHRLIQETIAELGGAVAPKLNWSSPKDAKWISPHQNTLKCTTPNDIYLLLKSSSFVSHDLTHAFDGCTAAPPSRPLAPVLVLRPFFNPHVALEFRCFVKHRALIGISQRDLNYYAFLDRLRPHIWHKIRSFFREKLRLTFPDASFAFDVYIPESSLAENKLGNVRLMDINPWAPRTDSLLFSWQELLDAEVKDPLYGSAPSGETAADVSDEEEDDVEYGPDAAPELRLIEKDDPAAFNFSTPQYSAHKLPKEVVDASMGGEGGIREFAQRWKDITEGRGGDMWNQPGGRSVPMPAKGAKGGKGGKSPNRVHKIASPARATRSRQRSRSNSPQVQQRLEEIVAGQQGRTKLPKGRTPVQPSTSPSIPSSPRGSTSGSQHPATNAFKPVNAPRAQHGAPMANMVYEAIMAGAYGNPYPPLAASTSGSRLAPGRADAHTSPSAVRPASSSSAETHDSHITAADSHDGEDSDENITAGDMVRKIYGEQPKIESSQCVKLAGETALREPVQRRPGQRLNLERRSNVEALLCHVAGTPAPQQCKNCRKGHGPWNSCVVYDGLMCSSCSNCWFNASGARCTFHVPDNGATRPSGHGQAGIVGTQGQVPQPQAMVPPNPYITHQQQPAALLGAAAVDVDALHGGNVARYRMNVGAQNAINRGLNGAATATHEQRLLTRIESAAKELGMRIAEYDEYVKSVQAQQSALSGDPTLTEQQVNESQQEPPANQQHAPDFSVPFEDFPALDGSDGFVNPADDYFNPLDNSWLFPDFGDGST
ncbi:cell cycle control protein [Purpureocillium lavendulum]|uniref:Cell cycle control protein n=1 Tax=Purpureocillium lavendulum TaxID=1247861 RepID=A0AB34G152_9HYPO|nr:cell cycle control protein [Purpureocillium lavendulum]